MDGHRVGSRSAGQGAGDAQRKAKRAPQRRALYQQTAEALRGILRETEPGAFLPSEPMLAEQLGVSRATLREAMRSFEERGWIVRRQGVGTLVSAPPPMIEAGLEVLESLETLARRSGLAVDTGDLAVQERLPTREEAALMRLALDAKVVQISRVMLADRRPVAYLVDTLPAGYLRQSDLARGFRGSVLDLLLRADPTSLAHSRTEITAVSAPPAVARPMRILRGDVLLKMDACLYLSSGEVVDRSESFFLPGVFRFHVVRRIGRLG